MDIEDLCNCSICMESFDGNLRPRTLSCGHTFCTDCINNTIKDEGLECPHCKAPIRASDASDFPISYITETMITKIKEANLEAALPRTTQSETSLFESSESSSQTQLTITDVKESLKNITEVTKATETDVKNYRTFLHKRVAKHEELMKKIGHILELNEIIIKELEREDGKVVKFLKERQKYQTEINKTLSRLDNVTESLSNEYEKLEELHDTLVGWNTKCKLQFPCLESFRHSEEIVRKTSATLKQFEEEADVPTKWIDVSKYDLSIKDKEILLEYIYNNENLQAILAPKSKIVKEGLVWTVQEREGRFYTARISSENGKTYLHCLRENLPPSNVLSVKYDEVIEMVNKDSMISFMDLSWEGSIKGRIHILLSPQTPLATHFHNLSTAQLGPSYLHTTFFEVDYDCYDDDDDECYSYVIGGDYESNDGSGGAPIFQGLDNDSDIYRRQVKEGSVGIVDHEMDGPRSAQFKIYTKGHWKELRGIFGQVQDRLDLVREAIRLDDIEKVRIEDCGIVLPF